MSVDAATQTVGARGLGVLGDPVAHSLSPLMHNAALRVMGLPHVYLPFHVREAALREALRGARALGFLGLNLTVPHKSAALAELEVVTDEVSRIGAANVVTFDDGIMTGHNTDGRGFLAALRELRAGAMPMRAVVLGAGGASLAIVDALASQGTAVSWISREPSPASRLCSVSDLVRPMPYDRVTQAFRQADLLVNTTTVGMSGGPSQFPVPLPLEALPDHAVVLDVVYPRPAGGLLDCALARGLRVQDGRTMLFGQGVLALELFLRASVPWVARQAMRAALGLVAESP